MSRIFLQPLGLIRTAPGAELRLGDVARCIAESPEVESRLAGLTVGQGPESGRFSVLRLTDLVRCVLDADPGADVRLLGGSDVVVEGRLRPAAWRSLLGAAAWVLIALGTATAILNFHADVNVPAAHREIYRLLTGRRTERPLLIEVPYAVGVGAGILIFFRRPGTRRRPGGEPSPLEIETAQYEARLAEFWRCRGRGRK